MSQQRITLFFPRVSRKKASPDVKCHLLELPSQIRRQIYHEAGLVSGKVIHLNNWRPSPRRFDDQRLWENGHDPRHWDPWGDAQDARSTALPTNLLAVCRLIHDEIRAILYGENRFVISRKLSRGLGALENMSDATLREMTFLTVRVNVSSCENFCCGGQRLVCRNGISPCRNPISHDTGLDYSSATGQLVISQWQRICSQLARATQAGRLALYVICDCADATTARMIVKPLLLLPALRDCGIRLAVQAEEEISALAKDTALSLTHTQRPEIPPPFPFLDLPKEIQLRVLRFTPLVNFTVICAQNRLYYGVSCHQGGKVAENTDHACVDPRPLLQCFCGCAHSAFNFRCNCKDKIFPRSLFFISKAFKDAAMQVFYSKNKFVVSMEGNISRIPGPNSRSRLLAEENIEQTDDRSTDSIIPGLANFPQSSLKHLTKLQLRFPWHELKYLHQNHPGWKYWLDTIDLLSREANLGAVTLDLHFNESFYSDLQIHKDSKFNPEYESHMLQTYKTFVRSMAALCRVKRLFIHLNWDTSFEVSDQRVEYEGMLEKSVMGENYDAWKYGKTFNYSGSFEEHMSLF